MRPAVVIERQASPVVLRIDGNDGPVGVHEVVDVRARALQPQVVMHYLAQRLVDAVQGTADGLSSFGPATPRVCRLTPAEAALTITMSTAKDAAVQRTSCIRSPSRGGTGVLPEAPTKR